MDENEIKEMTALLKAIWKATYMTKEIAEKYFDVPIEEFNDPNPNYRAEIYFAGMGLDLILKHLYHYLGQNKIECDLDEEEDFV